MNLTIFGDDFNGLSRLSDFLYIALIAAVVCSILCFVIMKNKDYEPASWAVFGLFLGIIAVFVCIIMPRKANTNIPIDQQYGQPYQPYEPYGQPYQQPYQPPILNENNAVTCPHCLELTPKESLFCIKCGCKLD